MINHFFHVGHFEGKFGYDMKSYYGNFLSERSVSTGLGAAAQDTFYFSGQVKLFADYERSLSLRF